MTVSITDEVESPDAASDSDDETGTESQTVAVEAKESESISL